MTIKHKLPGATRVTVWIDGLQITTTMRDLREGAVSSCIAQLVRDFEAIRKMKAERGDQPSEGYGTTYLDFHDKPRNLQINLA